MKYQTRDGDCFLTNSSKILLQKSLHSIMNLINLVHLLFITNSLLLITVYLLTVAATAKDLNIAPCLSIVTLNYQFPVPNTT